MVDVGMGYGGPLKPAEFGWLSGERGESSRVVGKTNFSCALSQYSLEGRLLEWPVIKSDETETPYVMR